MNIPHYPQSYWKDHKPPHSFAPLNKDLTVDVTVVGGGITGIVTAWKLAQEGKTVALLEGRKLMDGTTGFTTAKVTAQHSLIYQKLLKTFNEDFARLYYEANMEAIHFLKETANKLAINCDLTTQDAYVFTGKSEMQAVIEKEAEAYRTLGIKGGIAGSEVRKNTPFAVAEAIVMQEQAQYHPVKFLEALVKNMVESGNVFIFEDTRAKSLKGRTVKTTEGYEVTSDHIVAATHFPFNDAERLYFAKLQIKRSYVIGLKSGQALHEGMYLSADVPSRSVRYTPLPDGEKLLLIGGESHHTGRNKEETVKHYEKLAEFAEHYYQSNNILYRWSAQDLMTLDSVPYIGQSQENVYVATGYAKWGMTSGLTAANIISDLILKKDNRFAAVFDPKRPKAKPKDAAKFIMQNTGVAKELISGKAERPKKTVDDLKADEGSIVEWKGQKAGAYKDEGGTCHVVDVTCTHMGCETKWNDAERSWDCPCHGSRFSYDGKVLEGPAVKPLKKM